jgi:D-beta-D-heptose 7-phosphate kinase/D-beta-D-heptose 1-phosphate adenosyltransferase
MKLLEKYSKVKILVIGDVMIDKYLWGDVSRISPEAPVPVVKLKKTDLIAGGAANVAANIVGLGAQPLLVSVIGDDLEGEIFRDILENSSVRTDYLLVIPNRQTTVKTRVIAHNQQVVRIDQETTESLSYETEEILWDMIQKIIEEVNIIVISDYNKGLLNQSLLTRLIKIGRSQNKIILVDPKGKDYSKYKGASILTPNKLEVSEVCAAEETENELLEAGKSLLFNLELEALLITRGEDGMTLLEKGKQPVNLKALARKVYDVTGAGDTVIGTLAVSMAAGEGLLQAAEIANISAGLVVEEVGTTTINLNKLEKALLDKLENT